MQLPEKHIAKGQWFPLPPPQHLPPPSSLLLLIRGPLLPLGTELLTPCLPMWALTPVSILPGPQGLSKPYLLPRAQMSLFFPLRSM